MSEIKNFVEELRWRGMIHDVMPGTEEQLNKEMTSGYVGIDPTADSLHIGHLVGVMMLKHLQLSGHRPIALIGGATGMIGDPSGKSQERNLLDEKTLRHNQECLKAQLSKFLDFESNVENRALLVNNYDWMKEFSFLGFIRDIGKHITVNYMMAKDSVKKLLGTEGVSGMSFTEFSYQLVQGYDFLWLYEHEGCKLQMGGADQWGNITTGTELIRRKLGHENNAYALTCPLITKADGSKFGKTETGNVWLDPEKTSPYEFYQFWMNVSDEDAERYVKIFTLLSRDEIKTLVKEHREAPHTRLLQKTLASYILSNILRIQKGNPLSLGLLYLIVAQSVNLPVFGVNLPTHFILVYMDDFISLKEAKDYTRDEVLFYLNPFNKGALFRSSEVALFLKQLKIKESPEFFLPGDNLTIIRRLMEEMIVVHLENKNQDKAKELKYLLSALD